MFTVLEGSELSVGKVVEPTIWTPRELDPAVASIAGRLDQCGSRTGRRDLPMVVVEFNRGAVSDAVVALDARVRGASLEKACCRGDNG